MDDAKRQVIAAALRDRYEFLNQLGEGGFGTIFKARQLATGQPVALKVLRLAEDVSPEARERRVMRFQREMQMCARMHHPNIVQLIDSGQTREGAVYTVFEYAPGKNLAQVIAEEGGLEPAEARHLMLQLLDALACAHELDVVHRDLKPANIMVVPTGARRNALVVDFGIGLLADDASSPSRGITNESIGTPAYAAPEQLRGQAPTPRSDLYSWGLLFLECLTGRRVVEGASAAEIIFKQLSPEPIAIPDALAEHPLGALLRRVTQKDPEQRAVSAKELLRELEALDVRGLSGNSGLLEPQPDAGGETSTLEARTHAASAPERLVEGERRQITTLCCRLAASGVAGAQVDPDELDHLLGLQQEVCGDIVRRFDGLVAGALGDTMLFHFGYPRAREDDARRAAQAALEMAAELDRRAAALESQRQVRLEMRLGLHTGMIVARELRELPTASPGYVVGETPRVATQLCDGVEPGHIAVSDESARLLRKHFVLERPAAGEGEAPRALHLYEESRARESADVALVGRDRELELLLERWRMAAGGRGQATLISGEPGIGKSRLVHELREKLAGQPQTWVDSRCTPTTTQTPFYAVGQLLARLLELAHEPNPETRAARIEQKLTQHGFAPAEVMPLLAPLLNAPLPPRFTELDVSAPKRRELTHGAILSLLFELAEQSPLTLVIEDLHWADTSSLELLAQLLAEVGSSPVLAVFTSRPDFVPSWPATAALLLQLGRLGRGELEQLSRALTHGRALPPEVLEHLATRTDGVPLFVEELLRTLQDSGALVERDGAYVLTRPLSDVVIPSTLRDLLVSRLDRLGAAKETAQVAAALGREFSSELLRAVSPLPESELQEVLTQLLSAEVLYRRRRLRSSLYVFKHALIRDAAYDSMLKRSRQQVHARIAQALEERFPETRLERPEQLAHHHAAADQKPRAIGHARQAALNAMQRAAPGAALVHCRSALGWVDSIPEPTERAGTELGLIGVLAPALMTAEGYATPALGEAFARARTLCETLGKPPQLFPLLWGLGAFYAVRAQHRTALDLGAEVLQMAQQAGDPAQLVPAHLLTGGAKLWRGEFNEARMHLDAAVRQHVPEQHGALADVYSYEPGISARSYLALNLWFLGHPDESLASSQDASARATALNHFHTQVHTWVRAAQLHLLRREGPAALALAERILAVSEDKGLALWLGLGRALRGWALLENGQPEQGAAELRAGLEGWTATGADVHRAWLMTALAEAELRGGRVDEGLATVTQALGLCETLEDRIYEAEAHRLHGELELARGDEARAEAHFTRALEVARRQGARSLELRAALSQARLWQRRGENVRARRLVEEARAPFGASTVSRDLEDAARLLGPL